MLPSPRSWLPWCLLGLALLSMACSRKPQRGEDEGHVETDADVATDVESDADTEDPEQPVDASTSLLDVTPTPDDADPPSSADGAADAASGADSTIVVAQDATALDAPAHDSESGDAGPLDAGAQPAEGGEACQGAKVKAAAAGAAQIDFVWIIDSSASMFDEQKRLRNALNSFVERVAQSKLDVRVIMVSRTPTLTPTGVGIPPGLCPEYPPDPLYGHPFANDPRYHFVQTNVDSPALLRVAINDYPRYSALLRPGSAVHLLSATDDEAQYTGGAAQFVTDMKSLLGRSFHFHTFASPGPTSCTPSECKPDVDAGSVCTFLSVDCRAANVGATYYQLATLTNGVAVSICELDWRPGLQAIFERVAESTPGACSYPVPSPPQGAFNPDKLNLELTTQGSSQGTLLPRVGSSGACGDQQSWLYENANAPTHVRLCPKACSVLGASDSLTFHFGCSTVVQE